MRLYGLLQEFVDLIFRNSSNNTVTIDPDTAGTGGNTTLELPPVASGTDALVSEDATQTLTNKTLTSPVLDTSVSGTAVLDEDDMVSDSNTQLATQQSIKSYTDTTSSGAVSTHAALTSTHGVSGDLVGTTDSQSLTNKTIDADNNTISNLEHGAEVDDPTTGVHGVGGGSVVGTTLAQVLTAKDYDGGTASDTSRITVPQETETNLTALTRKEGTLWYANDLDKLLYDDGTDLLEVGSGAGGSIRVTFYDPESGSLPSTGAPVVVDGVTIQDGETVLFAFDEQVYEATVAAGNVTAWTALKAWESSSFTPQDGESARVTKGDAFAEQLVVYNSSEFRVNDIIRLFEEETANFWELGSIRRSTLTDNTTTSVFEAAYSGSENWIVNYSMTRGSGEKQTGQIYLTTDGTSVSTGGSHTSLGNDMGVTFEGDLDGSNIRLRATLTSTGTDATMKYYVARWSDAAVGGPTGVPSYTGAASGSSAAGSTGDVQFNAAGVLSANSKFNWDNSAEALSLDGTMIDVKKSATLTDNTTDTVAQFTASTNKYLVIEYGVERSGENQTGRILIAHNGTSASITDDFVNTAGVGVTFSADISGGNVRLRYTTTSTGVGATMTYNIRRWA